MSERIWIGIQIAMNRYCEPFFRSLEMWRYDHDVLLNRLQLIETACKIFKDRTLTYNFKLVPDNHNVDLLPEIAMLDFVEGSGSDWKAYHAAKTRMRPDIFGMAGLYFQQGLLPCLAGFSELDLKYACVKTRQSLLMVVETLFRLSESAGRAKIEYNEGSKIVELEPLSPSALRLYNLLIGVGVEEGPSKKAKIEAKEDTDWTTEHESIGTRIGAYFAEQGAKRPKTMLLYYGTVQMYTPETKPNEGDQLYHIIFDDNDQEDYDEEQYQNGIRLGGLELV